VLTKDVNNLLRGTGDFSNYGIEERDGKAYLRAAESIDGAGIVGVVSAGYALNQELIKKLEQVAGGKVLVTIGDRVYSGDNPRPVTNSDAGVPAESVHDRGSFWRRTGAPPSLEIRQPLTTDRGIEGTISIFFPVQEMTATIKTLQKTLLLVALLGIGLALAASWLLSRRLTRPLKDLVSGTHQVTAGNYDGTIVARSKDEIGALAGSFNSMLQELRRSKSQVESYRKELERKVAERGEQLIETEKKRAAMAHMIAHDLKNPLLGIKKTLERLEQTPTDLSSRQGKRILTDLLSAGDLVIGMANEMLDIYRSDFGEIPLSQTAFQVEEMIQTSLRILGPDIEEKQIEVLVHSDPPHISVVADKRRLTRLLINLLSNAIKFSGDRGRVFISTIRREQNGSGPWLELRVEDEGVGMPAQELPRIFDRFYSQDKEKAETGTGLGLPYCKLVAEAHGGTIVARNRAPRGFMVAVFLPVHDWKAEGFYAA